MREWGKRSFCLVCMFLVLTGMPVTVQAADYDGGTGSAEKTQETYLKRSGLCRTGYVDQRGAVSGAEGKIQLLRDGAGIACGWNRSDLHGKNRTLAV